MVPSMSHRIACGMAIELETVVLTSQDYLSVDLGILGSDTERGSPQ